MATLWCQFKDILVDPVHVFSSTFYPSNRAVKYKAYLLGLREKKLPNQTVLPQFYIYQCNGTATIHQTGSPDQTDWPDFTLSPSHTRR